MKILHMSNVFSFLQKGNLEIFPRDIKMLISREISLRANFQFEISWGELEGYHRYFKGIKISSSQFGEKLKRISVKPQGVDFKRNFPPSRSQSEGKLSLR